MIHRFGFKSCLVLLLISTMFSCDLDDGNSLPIPESDLIDIATAIPELSSLLVALERANLTSSLQTGTKYTVLAPTNLAFDNFLNTQGYASIDDVPVAVLEQLFQNHLINGQVDTTPLINLQRNYLQTRADGPTAGTKLSMYFDAVNGITFNGIATITQADVLASNGILHVVDAVIELPTLDTFISNDLNFDILETAIDLAAPFSTALEELDSNGPYTLFAPTEHAFENLMASNNDWEMISDMDEEFLASVLEHHIVNGNIRVADISFGSSLTTLEGDLITFVNLDGNLEITDGSGNEGSIVGIPDLQASNGVIHGLVNNVLIPNPDN